MFLKISTMKKTPISVRPEITIWSRFRENSYDLWTVVLEFIDNSISSYEANLNVLKQRDREYSLKIQIIYDKEKETLTILDNAFGMDFAVLSEAVKPESKTKKQGPLNEHGMGMKNAAVWLGDCLKIESSCLRSEEKVVSLHDFDKYIRGEDENAYIYTDDEKVDVNKSFTRITVSKILTKRKITKGKFNKLVKTIAWTYNQRLDNKVKIIVCFKEGDKFIDFNDWNGKEYKICDSLDELRPTTFERDEIDFYKKDKRWCEWPWNDEISSKTNPQVEKLKFNGYIAITKSVKPFAGVYCSVKGRVIEHYQIEKMSKFTAQRKIFGFLDFESGVGTVQTKNKISWEADFEDLFIEKLNNFIRKNKIDEIAFELTNEEKDNDFIVDFVKQMNEKNVVGGLLCDYEKPTLDEEKKKAIFKMKDTSDILEITSVDQSDYKEVFNFESVKKLETTTWIFTFYLQHSLFKTICGNSKKKLINLANVLVSFFFATYKTKKDHQNLMLLTLKKLQSYFKQKSTVEIERSAIQKTKIDENKITQEQKPIQQHTDNTSIENKNKNNQDAISYEGKSILPDDFLNDYKIADIEEAEKNREKARDYEEKINQVLEMNGIPEKISNYVVGSQFTRYMIKLKNIGNVNKILKIDTYLRLKLGNKNITIEQPIGESTVGIDVANNFLVRVDAVNELKELQIKENELVLPIGQHVDGKIERINLETIPHLLIAGATGSGKSVFLKCLITFLISQKTPSELKIMIIDGKEVSSRVFIKTPHLMEPIVSDVTKVTQLLDKAIAIVKERTKIFSDHGVENILELNKKVSKSKRLPFVVLIMDETAKMFTDKKWGKEITEKIHLLASEARFAGLYMIIAMQRPDAKIITGEIKANFLGRITFSLPAHQDSQVILNESGAENLRGRGDLIYKKGSKMVRLQGFSIEKSMISKIVNFLAEKFNSQSHETR